MFKWEHYKIKITSWRQNTETGIITFLNINKSSLLLAKCTSKI